MIAKDSDRSSEPNPDIITANFNLNTLADAGPDALATRTPSIAKITLLAVELAFESEFHPILVKKADDLFACSRARGLHEDLFPKGAKVTRATLLFELAHSAGAYLLDLHPDRAVALLAKSIAAPIRACLAQSPFATTRATLANLLLAVALSINSALPASVDADADDDDDGDEGNRSHHTFTLAA